MPFETALVGLTGTITHHILDPAGIDPPSTIIQTDDAWDVEVDWGINGVPAFFLGGEWHVRVFAESVGPGPEQELGHDHVPVAAAPPALNRAYNMTIHVPAGTLPEGTYKLVTVINYTNGGIPGEMAGFDDQTVVQVYEPS